MCALIDITSITFHANMRRGKERAREEGEGDDVLSGVMSARWLAGCVTDAVGLLAEDGTSKDRKLTRSDPAIRGAQAHNEHTNSPGKRCVGG